MPDFIETEDGYLLPDFLFYFDSSRSKNINPAASFSPVDDCCGDPFLSSTAPSQVPIKKAVVIDALSFGSKYLSILENCSILKKLGFTVYLRIREEQNHGKKFLELQSGFEGNQLIELINALDLFNDELDYDDLLEIGIEKDSVILYSFNVNYSLVDCDIRRVYEEDVPVMEWFKEVTEEEITSSDKLIDFVMQNKKDHKKISNILRKKRNFIDNYNLYPIACYAKHDQELLKSLLDEHINSSNFGIHFFLIADGNQELCEYLIDTHLEKLFKGKSENFGNALYSLRKYPDLQIIAAQKRKDLLREKSFKLMWNDFSDELIIFIKDNVDMNIDILSNLICSTKSKELRYELLRQFSNILRTDDDYKSLFVKIFKEPHFFDEFLLNFLFEKLPRSINYSFLFEIGFEVQVKMAIKRRLLKYNPSGFPQNFIYSFNSDEFNSEIFSRRRFSDEKELEEFVKEASRLNMIAYDLRFLKFINEILNKAPNLNCIILNKELLGKIEERPGIVFIYKEYKGLSREGYKNLGDDIFIGRSNISEKLDYNQDSRNLSFLMARAGIALKKDQFFTSNFRINARDSDYWNEGFFSVMRIPNFEECENIAIAELNSDHIASFRAAVDDNSYFQFQQIIKAGEFTRLISGGVDDEFMGIVGTLSLGAEVKKDQDGFFYIKTNEDCEIDYVIKTSSDDKQWSAYGKTEAREDGDDIERIKAIIEEYKDPTKGYKDLDDGREMSVLEDEFDTQKRQEWLDKIYEERSGVCGHRVAAVLARFAKMGIDKSNYREVIINNNHVLIEIKIPASRFEGDAKDEWCSIDLGGGSLELSYSSQKYEAPSTKEEALKREILKKKQEESESRDKVVKKARGSEEAESETTARISIIKSYAAPKITTLKDPSPLLQRTTPIHGAGAFASETYSDQYLPTLQKTLLISKKINEDANILLNQIRLSGAVCFYIDSPDKLKLEETRVVIGQKNDEDGRLKDEEVIFENGGELRRFLDFCDEKPDLNPPPILMINWSNFNAKQKVALNTILDEERGVKGREISRNIKIIGLAAENSTDPSFNSRHDAVYRAEFIKPLPSVGAAEVGVLKDLQIIDLQGFPNWKRNLFGAIILEREKMVWHKSDFSEKLFAGDLKNFKIINASSNEIAEIEYELAKAKACGYFEYNGFIFPFADLNIEISKEKFNFKEFDFSAHEIERDSKFSEDSSDFEIINTYLFDQLLQDHEITRDGFYIEKPGLLVRSAEDKLDLFITSNLSESQWYCLFNEAKKYNVELNLKLATGVNLPNSIIVAKKDFEEEASQGEEGEGEEERKGAFAQDSSSANLPRIIISKSAKYNTDSLTESTFKDAEIIDVEDLTYQDIIYKTEFERTATGFGNFEMKFSEIIEKLTHGKKVILRGKFSQEMIRLLEPLFADQYFADKLIVIIEDKSIDSASSSYRPLTWRFCEFDFNSRQESKTAEIYHENKIAEDENLEDSKKISDEFIATRREEFAASILENPMIQLVSESGAGKSRLMRSIANKYLDNFTLYHDLKDLKSWAMDNKAETANKIKILFIDESNIEDTNFMVFEPLKLGGNKRIFYQGEFFELSDNHRVVFARNPKEYGGGRVEQKLFADGEIPEFHLSDFPKSYIYEQILKKAIWDKISLRSKDALIDRDFGEDEFKKECITLINNYQKANEEKPESLTARELQQRVLDLIHDKLYPGINIELSSQSFTSTAATKESENILHRAIFESVMQKTRDFPSKAVGLNGILFEGDSGIGKSEMIAEILRHHKIEITRPSMADLALELDETEYSSEIKKKICYKVDASMSMKQKSAIIIKAFEEGNMVWIDEINSCLNDGLEKVLNAVLTGFNPETQERSKNPGFLLVASTNQASIEGRSIISPAIYHRTIHPKLKSLQEYEVEDLEKIIKSWNVAPLELDEDDIVIKQIATDFKDLLQNPRNKINLRDLKRNIYGIFLDYVACKQKDAATTIIPSYMMPLDEDVIKVKNKGCCSIL